MRFVLAAMFAALVVSAMIVQPVLADCGKGCTCPKCKERDKQITNLIYDLTIPWPFRKHVSDSDCDGVSDKLDKCPNTPKGAIVDETGCPKDADGDGVPDGIDKCPNTPKGATVDASGCPADADGDGVYDGIDQCPNTPAGVRVDARGCPEDSDGDGVNDDIDKCPDTPKGTRVDDKGCPVVSEVERAIIDTGIFSTTEIVFESAKADIKPESENILAQIGDVLAKHPELTVEIGGHTDSQRSEAYNQKLSEQRAQAVRDYLMSKHPEIKGDQLTTKGYGESKPVASNDTPEGRAKNRRVEFIVTSQ